MSYLITRRLCHSVCLLSFFLYTSSAISAPVPGDPPRAGTPLPGLTASELAYFEAGKEVFLEIEGGDDNVFKLVHKKKRKRNEPSALGPRFNLDSCAGCHLHPAVGGSSPPVNPQVTVATFKGAKNTIPYFVSSNGPVREARFKFNSDGTRDGGVHNLFVITGRSDVPTSCNIKQPNFDEEKAKNNISLRIPTPTFGLGLVEAIPDATILANKLADAARKRDLGISGHENRNGNDGTITRFGWKAQNKSLLLFAGEAYNVEQGVSNEIFQTERDETPGCNFNGTPEDLTNFASADPIGAFSDIALDAQFMKFLAPPTPKPFTPAAIHGSALFNSIGCGMCHTPTLTTGASSVAAISNQPANLYSDLLVHSMGPLLADNIIQGLAGPDEFRTAPLWGLGQRLFYLHDGRTSDLTTAIRLHASRAGGPGERDSEANRVIDNFNRLSTRDKADLIEFLQSL